MEAKSPDFTGYATKVGLVCSDGRTIMPDAFKHQDGTKVPLVWQHSHDDPENVLGHVILTNRDDGVHVKAYFNKSKRAAAAKEAIEHEDINQMSIWANKLTERAKQVLHGTIREVSLVLAGANPGALIDNVTISHADGSQDVLNDVVVIYTGELIHTAGDDEFEGDEDSDPSNEDKGEDDLEHEDSTVEDNQKTIKEVYDTMDEEQKNVTAYLVEQGIAAGRAGLKDPDEDENKDGDAVEHTAIDEKEGNTVKHNVFEQSDTGATGPSLSHDDLKEIVADAKRTGSLKHAFERYAHEHLQHGINDIDVLFPDAKMIGDEPELLSRRMEWVNAVLTAARKSPFARIRTMSADITEDEARAKGYVTGEFKREEFFSVTKRETTPQTVYKKQKLERDDIIDITDLDVVTWLKREMRVMLDEEIARAALIGDGRDIAHTDKISETHIRPVAKDHELFTSVVNVDLEAEGANIQTLIDAIVMNRSLYKGSGQPTLYTSESIISRISLIKDGLGRRLYKSLDEFASEIRVKEVVPVEAMDDEPDIIAILVNMADYNFGTDRGGEVNMFDDFDIDYNNYKYLIETRLSGALVRLKSAIVYKQSADGDTLVTPDAPTFNVTTGVLTIPTVTGVTYYDNDTDDELSSGAQAAIPNDAIVRVRAEADTGYYFPPTATKTWSFQRNSA